MQQCNAGSAEYLDNNFLRLGIKTPRTIDFCLLKPSKQQVGAFLVVRGQALCQIVVVEACKTNDSCA